MRARHQVLKGSVEGYEEEAGKARVAAEVGCKGRVEFHMATVVKGQRRTLWVDIKPRRGGGWAAVRKCQPSDWLGPVLESCAPIDSLQANETFAFVGNVTHYAQVWLNISTEIRSFLEQGRLQQHLHWLQQVLWGQGGWALVAGSSV